MSVTMYRMDAIVGSVLTAQVPDQRTDLRRVAMRATVWGKRFKAARSAPLPRAACGDRKDFFARELCERLPFPEVVCLWRYIRYRRDRLRCSFSVVTPSLNHLESEAPSELSTRAGLSHIH